MLCGPMQGLMKKNRIIFRFFFKDGDLGGFLWEVGSGGTQAEGRAEVGEGSGGWGEGGAAEIHNNQMGGWPRMRQPRGMNRGGKRQGDTSGVPRPLPPRRISCEP